MQHWWYDIWKRINDSKSDPNNTRMMLSFPTNSSCPIINNISNKMLNKIKNFLKLYNAIFWSKRKTIVFFHAWKSGWCLINHYEIQNFEIPIKKNLNLKSPRQRKIFVFHILDLLFKGFQNPNHVLTRLKSLAKVENMWTL